MKLRSILTDRHYLSWLPVILILILVVLMPVRDIILRKSLSWAYVKLKTHHIIVHWDGATFRGLKSVFIKGIYIQDEKSDNEIYIDSVSVNVRILPLIFRNVRINKLDCRKISVRYQEAGPDSVSEKRVPPDSSGIFTRFAGKNLSEMANKYIRRFFSYVPSRTTIRILEARITYAGKRSVAGFRNFKMLKGELSGMLYFSGEGSSINIPVRGRIDKSSFLADVSLVNNSRLMLPFPYFRDKYGVEAGFDTLHVAFDLSGHDRHKTNVSGEVNFSGFELKGERLAVTSIKIGHFKSSFLSHLGKDYMELDSSTVVYLNNIRLIPFFRIYLKDKPYVELKLLPVKWEANDFFMSLPEGMFTSLTGLRAKGSLQYFLNFEVDMETPDSLKFDTRLTSENFKILEYGIDDYRMLNNSFNHKVYEKGQLKTSFLVGAGSPDFVTLEQISPFLRAAVMTSEDGSFFFHNGFNPGAFRGSIVTNIKEKRFARGGSTITMQLVKNVFLTRSKTVARKIEEALIVWMIENQNLVSKNRLYEVYLNLIEWGPGIYGISQASRFYFDKKPQDLNLQESIYLASIVPRPKWYKYTFDTNGVPRSFFGNYFHRMEELMVKKKFIEAGDTMGVKPLVTLTGPAAQAFNNADSIRSDPFILKEMETLPATIKLNIKDQ